MPWLLRMRGAVAAVALVLAAVGQSADAAEPIRILAAGSLGGVLPKLIKASGLPPDTIGAPVFGPAGMLRDRLLAGEQADLFASADMTGPTAVAGKAGQALVVSFARNRMCVLAPEPLGLTAPTLLDRILAPDFRLAVSTPGADPGGDYAHGVFKRAEQSGPGPTLC